MPFFIQNCKFEQYLEAATAAREPFRAFKYITFIFHRKINVYKSGCDSADKLTNLLLLWYLWKSQGLFISLF